MNFFWAWSVFYTFVGLGFVILDELTISAIFIVGGMVSAGFDAILKELRKK